MTAERILFLDVDGVLNSVGSVLALGGPSDCLDPVSVGLVARLCRETGAKIVVSSTWRIGRDVERLKEELARAGAPQLAEFIIDKTDTVPGIRGKQIARWLEANDFSGRYVIVDDDSDMLPEQKPYFVQTCYADGFRARHYTDAMAILDPKHADSQIIVPA